MYVGFVANAQMVTKEIAASHRSHLLGIRSSETTKRRKKNNRERARRQALIDFSGRKRDVVEKQIDHRLYIHRSASAVVNG